MFLANVPECTTVQYFALAKFLRAATRRTIHASPFVLRTLSIALASSPLGLDCSIARLLASYARACLCA